MAAVGAPARPASLALAADGIRFSAPESAHPQPSPPLRRLLRLLARSVAIGQPHPPPRRVDAAAEDGHRRRPGEPAWQDLAVCSSSASPVKDEFVCRGLTLDVSSAAAGGRGSPPAAPPSGHAGIGRRCRRSKRCAAHVADIDWPAVVVANGDDRELASASRVGPTLRTAVAAPSLVLVGPEPSGVGRGSGPQLDLDHHGDALHQAPAMAPFVAGSNWLNPFPSFFFGSFYSFCTYT